MKLTSEALKATRYLFFAILLLVVLNLVLSYFGILNHSINGHTKWHLILIERLYFFLPTLILWLALAYVTKDFYSIIPVLAIYIGWYIYVEIQSHKFSYAFEPYMPGFWQYLLVNILVYSSFALLHFRKWKALWMPLAFFLIAGADISAKGGDLMWMLCDNRYVDVNFNDFLFNLFSVFLDLLKFVVYFILLYFVYNWLDKGTFPNLKFIKLDTVFLSKFEFSILYWSFRIMLFAMAFGLVRFVYYFDRNFPSYPLLPYLLWNILGTYVLAVLYRNFVTSYFVQRGFYPSWLYLLLNIPILNIIAWLICLFPHGKTGVGEDTTEVSKPGFKGLQEYFSDKEKNKGIKVIITLIIIVFAFVKIGFMSFDTQGFTLENPAIAISVSLVSIGLFVAYFSYKNVIYYLIGFYVLASLILNIRETGNTFSIFGLAAMSNLIIYYPLFHFDKFLPHQRLLSRDSDKT